MKKCVFMATAAAVLAAWTASAQDVPKAGVFLGYSYVHFNPAGSASSFSANGGNGQFVYNFNKWLGGVADLGAVNNSNQNGIHADTTFFNFLFGPRLTFTHRSRFRPYAQLLWGGVYATSSAQITAIPALDFLPGGPVVINPGEPITARVSASQTAFAMTAGGGLDIRIGKHVSFRPFEFSYYLTRLQNLTTAEDNTQNNWRYSGGVAFWFGGEKPAPQANRQMATRTCPDGSVVPINTACPKKNFSLSLTATPAELCQGETARLSPSFSGAAPNQLTFSSWSVNGQPVSDTGAFEFKSEGRAPGTYTVKLTTGGDAFNPASAETTITVLEYQAPTGTVSASPSEIHAGDKSSISSNFRGQCGGPIQAATYEASEGTMQGDQFDSSSMQWDTSNNAEQRKTVTITAKASDNRNTGSATTTVDVVRGAVVMPVRLPDVLFPANSSRVNNCGKRILLEQLRAYYERDSSGTVVLVGNSSSDETAADIAQKRVANAAAVITAGRGVCLSIPQSQVQVSSPGTDQNGVSFESSFCQSSVGRIGPNSDMRRVQVWFVPSGGQLPASVTNSQAASTLSLSNLGCPK
ncbi:MAG TPA: outer membrane beta-barrel protein [Bryobacteraceae bacterium]|nr:outer membrane beta-barrel protein [Bryobacteraceae bacterium]